MRFWVRELSGWVLVLLGLFVFYTSYAMLVAPAPRLLEAGPLAFIGFIVFRGGIHLLKVALAARVALHAEQTLSQGPPAPRSAAPRDPHAGRLRAQLTR